MVTIPLRAPGHSADRRRPSGAFGLLIAFCVAQVGSLFSADAWNNITFTAGEVKNPKRNIPLSLALGVGIVIVLYMLANIAYLVRAVDRGDPERARRPRRAPPRCSSMFGPVAALIMAIAIVISTFGCNNGLILAGARVYYAMARDGLFFKSTGRLNRTPRAGRRPRAPVRLGVAAGAAAHAPARRVGRVCCSMPRGAPMYGNLYSNLLDYVVFSVLIFYILTIAGVFVLRRKRPDAERPYRAFGYPLVPIAYIARRARDPGRAPRLQDVDDLARPADRADRHPGLSVMATKAGCRQHLDRPMSPRLSATSVVQSRNDSRDNG